MSAEGETQESVAENTEEVAANQEEEVENSAEECEADQADIENSGEAAEGGEGNEEIQGETGDGEVDEEGKGESTEDQPSDYNDHGRRIVDDKDGPNKIFVGGITPETSDDDLRGYFSQHGNILDITIMKDRFTGKSRGFGFITFDTVEVAEKLVMSKHEINGKMVEAKPAVPRGSQNSGGRPGPAPNAADSQRSTKLFVGGLSPTVNDVELKEYFSQFGDVEEAIVVVDKDTNRKRGFGFVTFASYQSVDNVLLKSEHTVVDKIVEVKRALPKGSGPSGPMGRGGGPPMMPGRPGSYPPPRGYGPGPGGPGGPGYYPPGPAPYGQQTPGYGYYGGYDQRGGGYSAYSGGYGAQGYGGYSGGYGGYDQTGYTAPAYDYSQQQSQPAAYTYDTSGQYASQPQAAYDAQAYNGYYAAYNAAPAQAPAPAATAAAPAYGYDASSYGAATTTAASNRYHPYART